MESIQKSKFIYSNIKSADRDTKINIMQTIINHDQGHVMKAASNGQGTYIDLSQLSPGVIDIIHHLILKRTTFIDSKYTK